MNYLKAYTSLPKFWPQNWHQNWPKNHFFLLNRAPVLRVGRAEAGEGAAQDGGGGGGGGGPRQGRHLLRVGGGVDQPRLAAAPGLQ